MNDVVRVDVRRTRSPIARGEIFEKLNAWPGIGAHSGNAQMRSEHLVQMFLFRSKIFALSSFAQSQHIAIELQTRLCASDPNRGVIDAEKKFVGFLLPAWIAFARWKINDLQIMP